MKKTIRYVSWPLFCMVAAHLQAQSTFVFTNALPIFGPGLADPYKDEAPGPFTGSRILGEGFRAQLYAGVNAETLMPMFPVASFRTGARAGFIQRVDVMLPEVPVGTPLTVQMRVWDNSSLNYSSWQSAEAAWKRGEIPGAVSQMFNVTSSPGPSPAPAFGNFNI